MNIDKINRSEALRYMGYKGGEIPDNITTLIDQCEKALLECIHPDFVWKVMDISFSDNGVTVENTPLVFEGNDISAHLKDCTKCVLLAATLSANADRLIAKYETSKMEKAVITDCLSSAAIEQICDYAETVIKNQLEGYNFTWRFSPGYGDFPIEIQKKFVQTLDANKRIGLNVSASGILIPRKSVTAVMGISTQEISKGRRGCVTCRMKDICQYRKRGEHCGF